MLPNLLKTIPYCSRTISRNFSSKHQTLPELLKKAEQELAKEKFNWLKHTMPKERKIVTDYYNLSDESLHPKEYEVSVEQQQIEWVQKALESTKKESNFITNAQIYFNKKSQQAPK